MKHVEEDKLVLPSVDSAEEEDIVLMVEQVVEDTVLEEVEDTLPEQMMIQELVEDEEFLTVEEEDSRESCEEDREDSREEEEDSSEDSDMDSDTEVAVVVMDLMVTDLASHLPQS